ncbi:hypothetical protein Tco_1288822, partial [Tanacetum coccineum]
MGNRTASNIEGKGKIILKLTSEKDLILSNVLHVPNITKNMISDPILSNKGFKLVFESDNFVVTKGGVYVGKGYLDEGLFKLSVVTDDNVINNNNAGTSTASMFVIDPSFLWHSRLVIMEYLVNISKRRAFWSLNKDILKINNSDYQYAVSIKEDTAYPCLHSPKTTKETSPICHIQRRPIRRIEDI